MGKKVLLFNRIITLCPKTEVWIFQNEFDLCCQHMIRPVFYVLPKIIGSLILTVMGKTVLCCKKEKKKTFTRISNIAQCYFTPMPEWAIA